MASIFKRKDTGSWYVQWTHRGKLYREKVGKSKELAKIRLGEITRKKELGQLFVNTDMSLKDLMDRFKKSLQTDPLSERTRMRMENIFNNFEGYCKKENLEKLNQFDFTVLYDVNSTCKCNSTALKEGQAVVGFVLPNHSKIRSTYEALPPAHP